MCLKIILLNRGIIEDMAKLVNSAAERKIVLIIVLLVATALTVLLDIPVFRQVLGFVFLTFVPGLLILYILKLNKLGLTEKFVLSVGLSLFFSMFSGLLINWSYFELGYATPLSTNSLVISFSVILFILCIIAYKTNKEAFSFRFSEFKLNTTEKAFLLVPSIFPLLSIYGMHVMNTTNNNILLMALLFLIPAYVILVAFLNHKIQIPERVYPATIFLMGISVILMLSLRSSHIMGMDAHHEYYLFQLTAANQHWQILDKTTLDSCLSISLLPAIYQSFMNIDTEYLFKILFSLMFSISPLIVYIISRKYVGSFYAFFAAFFFISVPGFAITPMWARINIAILFFGLAIMVMNHKDISNLNKKALFIIFLLCIIVSHYSTTYVFFFLLLVSWIGMQIISTVSSRRRGATASAKDSAKKRNSSPFKSFVTISVIALFFITLFFWYSQVTAVAFDSGVRFIHNSIISLNEFFILEARGDIVETAFGRGETILSYPDRVEFIFSWATMILIAIGVLTTLIKFRERVSILPERGGSGSSLERIDAEFFAFSLACCFMLVVSVAVPYITIGYSMERQYLMAMVPLSLFLVLGVMTVSKYVKLKPHVILTTVLVLYFLCTSSALHQVFDDPRALTLNSEGHAYNTFYISEKESYGARWLGDNREKGITINADFTTHKRLMSQAGIRHGVNTRSLFDEDKEIRGYIFLRSHNVVDGKLMDGGYESHNITEYQDKFIGKDKIYSNGGSEVWR